MLIFRLTLLWEEYIVYDFNLSDFVEICFMDNLMYWDFTRNSTIVRFASSYYVWLCSLPWMSKAFLRLSGASSEIGIFSSGKMVV